MWEVNYLCNYTRLFVYLALWLYRCLVVFVALGIQLLGSSGCYHSFICGTVGGVDLFQGEPFVPWVRDRVHNNRVAAVAGTEPCGEIP